MKLDSDPYTLLPSSPPLFSGSIGRVWEPPVGSPCTAWFETLTGWSGSRSTSKDRQFQALQHILILDLDYPGAVCEYGRWTPISCISRCPSPICPLEIAYCFITQRFKKKFLWESEAFKRILFASFSFLKSELVQTEKKGKKTKIFRDVQKWWCGEEWIGELPNSKSRRPGVR